MANQETAYGLRPIGLVGSAVNSTGVTEYEIANNNTNALYNSGPWCFNGCGIRR